MGKVYIFQTSDFCKRFFSSFQYHRYIKLDQLTYILSYTWRCNIGAFAKERNQFYCRNITESRLNFSLASTFSCNSAFTITKSNASTKDGSLIDLRHAQGIFILCADIRRKLLQISTYKLIQLNLFRSIFSSLAEQCCSNLAPVFHKSSRLSSSSNTLNKSYI